MPSVPTGSAGRQEHPANRARPPGRSGPSPRSPNPTRLHVSAMSGDPCGHRARASGLTGPWRQSTVPGILLALYRLCPPSRCKPTAYLPRGSTGMRHSSLAPDGLAAPLSFAPAARGADGRGVSDPAFGDAVAEGAEYLRGEQDPDGSRPRDGLGNREPRTSGTYRQPVIRDGRALYRSSCQGLTPATARTPGRPTQESQAEIPDRRSGTTPTPSTGCRAGPCTSAAGTPGPRGVR